MPYFVGVVHLLTFVSPVGDGDEEAHEAERERIQRGGREPDTVAATGATESDQVAGVCDPCHRNVHSVLLRHWPDRTAERLGIKR